MSKRRRGRPAFVTPNSPRQGGRRPPAAPSRRLSPRLLLMGGSVAAAVLLLAFVFYGAATQRAYACDSRLTPGTAGPDGEATRDLGNRHVAVGATLEYAYCPPASGNHFAERTKGPIPARFYPPSSEASPGGWIHNLEHGYVVALYSCGDTGSACPSEAELNALRDFQSGGPPTAGAQACGIPSKVLTARFDSMASRFALLAWNRAALSETFDVAAAQSFAGRWIDQAPEAGAC